MSIKSNLLSAWLWASMALSNVSADTSFSNNTIDLINNTCDWICITLNNTSEENKISEIIVQDRFNSPILQLVDDENGLIWVLALTWSIDAFETLASADDWDDDLNDDTVYIVSTTNLLTNNIVMLEAGDGNNYAIDVVDYFYWQDFKQILAAHQRFSNSTWFGNNILSWDWENLMLNIEGNNFSKKDIETLRIVSIGDIDSKNVSLQNIDLQKIVSKGISANINLWNLDNSFIVSAWNWFNSLDLEFWDSLSERDWYNFEYASAKFRNLFNASDNMSQFSFTWKFTSLKSISMSDSAVDKEYTGLSWEVWYWIKSELSENFTWWIWASLQFARLFWEWDEEFVDNQYWNAATTFKLEHKNWLSWYATFWIEWWPDNVDLNPYYWLNETGDLVQISNDDFDNEIAIYNTSEFWLSYKFINKSGFSWSLVINTWNNAWDTYNTVGWSVQKWKFYLDFNVLDIKEDLNKIANTREIWLTTSYFWKNAKLAIALNKDKSDYHEDLNITWNVYINF